MLTAGFHWPVNLYPKKVTLSLLQRIAWIVNKKYKLRGSTVLEKYLIFTKYFGSSTSTSTSTSHFRQSSTQVHQVLIKLYLSTSTNTSTGTWPQPWCVCSCMSYCAQNITANAEEYHLVTIKQLFPLWRFLNVSAKTFIQFVNPSRMSAELNSRNNFNKDHKM